MGTKLLVVDDDFDLREEIVDLLLDDGYEAIAAKDGREGLREARRELPQGIVMDLSMPVMDGRALREELLADPTLAHIPIVIISADVDGPKTAAALGAHAFVTKPFSASTLLTALRTCSLHAA